MKKLKVLLDFIQLSVIAKIVFYRNVITKLTGNATFPTPDVSLVEAKAAVDALEAANLASRDGSRTAISAMHDAEEAADVLFRNLAAYVDRIAVSNETAILSSGFHVSKQPITAQKPELAVQDGDNSGSVWLVARAVDKAGAYNWQYAKDSIPEKEADWLTAGHTTQSYYQLTGLVVASKYFFRVSAVTPAGNSDFTAAVLKVVS
jgi:hypothetical protein